MFESIDRNLSCGVTQPTGCKVKCTRELFEDLLADLHLSHIRVAADPPYVALIDTQCWKIQQHQVLQNLCTMGDIKVVHLILEHVDTGEAFRCFNAHIPTRFGTKQRKESCVKKMCNIATDSAVQQRAVCMPLINRWRSQCGSSHLLRKASPASLNQNGPKEMTHKRRACIVTRN